MFFGGIVLLRPSVREVYAILLLSVLLSLKLTISSFLNALDMKFENIFYVASDLASIENHSMLTTEAGRLPYYSDWFTVDSWG